MRTFNLVMKIIIMVLLSFAIYLSGIYSAKNNQNQEENKSTITTIAVVNADAGTIVEGEKIFYAAELMSYPDTNFKSTGIEDARKGIIDGRYAAYVLIPEKFSESIVSVNGEPDKAQISYSLYDNLRQDIQVKVVNDIHNFILNLSTNISYIYVDAILKEVHDVQDNSSTIMKNDIEDMEAIKDFETADLIEEVEYEPLEVSETEIEYLDLTDDYEIVNKATENIYDTYTDNMETAEEEFLLIKDSSSVIGEQMIRTSDTIVTVNVLLDEEDNIVYEDGMSHLLEIVDQYEKGVPKKIEAKRSLGFIDTNEEQDDEQNEEEDNEEEDIYISKDELLEQVDWQITSLDEIKLALENGEDVSEKLNNNITALDGLKTDIERYYTDAITAIDNIPVLDELPPEIEQTIREEIASPIEAEATAEEEKVSAAIDTLMLVVEEYLTKVDEYDAMSYIEREIIDENTDVLFATIDDMETEIIEHDEMYLDYVDEVTSITDSNVQMLQENIDNAYTQTQENIIHTMEGFKENRANINEINVSMLDEITQKLLYTRLGKLEYTQVYDFIVQPITSKDESIVKNNMADTSVDMDKVDLICIYMGVIALIIIYITAQLIYKRISMQVRKERRKKNGRRN